MTDNPGETSRVPGPWPDSSEVVRRLAVPLIEADPTVTGLGLGREDGKWVFIAMVTRDPDRPDRPRELEGLPVRYIVGGPIRAR